MVVVQCPGVAWLKDSKVHMVKLDTFARVPGFLKRLNLFVYGSAEIYLIIPKFHESSNRAVNVPRIKVE